MGAGLAIASASVAGGGLVVVYLAATLTAAIRSEEAFLRGRSATDTSCTGAAWRRAGATARAAARRSFSVAQAIANREYRAVAGLGAPYCC